MNRIKKKGMTTGLGAMLLSIIAAGVVTTSSYDYKVDAKNEIAQAIQFSKYYDAVVSRVSDDTGYAVSNNADISVPLQNEKNQTGTPWLKSGDDKAKDCITKSACDGLFNGQDTEFGTMSKFRHLFTPIGSSCSYYSSDIGSWHSLNAISGNIMPCNIFRVRGPLNTKISDDSTALDVVTMVINTRTSKIDQSSEGIEDTKDILDVNFYIPISNYVIAGSDAKKKRLLVFADKVADLLNGKAAISIVKSGSAGSSKLTGFSPTAVEYGLGPSILLSNECEARGGKVCYLKVSFITRLHMKGGQGGCTDCLKLDSSNSMYGAITFKKKENKEEDLVDAVLLAWKTEGATKKERENPTPANTISGIITEGTGNKLKIQIEKNAIIQLESETDGKNQLILTPLEVTTKMDDKTFTGFTKTNANTPSEEVEFNINVDDNAIFHSKKKDGQYSVGINKNLNDNTDTGGIEVSDGVNQAILRVGNNKLVGVMMIAGQAGYYEVGEVGNGMIRITGTIKRGAEQMKVDLSFTSTQVTGTVNGTVPTGSSIYMNSSGTVYLRRATNTYFNLDIEVNPTGILTFDKKADVTGTLNNVVYDLAITDKYQGSMKSNILRTSADGVVESDGDHFKISKALDEFVTKPGPDDCYYGLDTTLCSVTQSDFDEFMHEVPNVEKTIELIKEYTPNKYISWESAWMPIKSKSDKTQSGLNMPSYYNLAYYKDGSPFSYPEVPERVRVLVRATQGYGGCNIPESLRDTKGNFFQEALPAAPTDDDINDTGSGVVYSFNRDGVQIYAPTKRNASQSRYLFYTYDGWGDEQAQFHCDVGHVKVIVYRPEQLTGTHNALMIQSPSMNMAPEYKDQFSYLQQSDTSILRHWLEPGIYFVSTEWNTDYYRAPEQYPEDVTLYVRKSGSAGSMVISDGTHWVIGEQPLRRTANTTFDIVQVNAAGYLELYMDVDDVGYVHPDGTFNGHIDVTIVSITQTI